MAGPADGRQASPTNPDKLISRFAAGTRRSRFIYGLHRTSRPNPLAQRVLTPTTQKAPELHFGPRYVAPAQRGPCSTSPAVCMPGHYRGFRPARPPWTVNPARAPALTRTPACGRIIGCAAGTACRSSDASVLTFLMTAVEPEQPSYLSHSDAAAAPVDSFPCRQTLIVSHRPQRLPSPPLSVPDSSIAFTKRGQHRDR